MPHVYATGQQRQAIEILGVPVDVVTTQGALDVIDGFVKGDRLHLVATADASGIAQAQTDPELMDIYRSADLVTADSAGVIWAAKRQGTILSERVSGVDLLEKICRLSVDRGYRIFFLGAAPSVAELAAERLSKKYPGCNIVGTRHGYFKPEEDEAVANEVAATRPDILFVAMGIPRQEKFLKATERITGAKVGMGVGGSLDVFSGKAKRAPVLFQKMKLEWLWRSVLNPKKWSKAKMLPKFLMMVLRAKK